MRTPKGVITLDERLSDKAFVIHVGPWPGGYRDKHGITRYSLTVEYPLDVENKFRQVLRPWLKDKAGYAVNLEQAIGALLLAKTMVQKEKKSRRQSLYCLIAVAALYVAAAVMEVML